VRSLVISIGGSVTALAFLLGFLIFTEDLARANTGELMLLVIALMLSSSACATMLLNWTVISEWADDDDDEEGEA
jgi:hypothetical protein